MCRPTGDSFADMLTAQLSDLPSLDWHAHGQAIVLSSAGTIFALVERARVYLRTDAASRERYRAWRMHEYAGAAPGDVGSYWQVPDCALEDSAQLNALALEALRGGR